MFKILLTLTTLGLLSACIPEQTSESTVTSAISTNNDSSDTSSDTSDEDYGKIPYYTFQNIIAHGGNSTKVIWSSERSVSPAIGDQNIFRTDATLKFRVIARPSPGKGVDSLGENCNYYAMNYSALKLKVGVRRQNSSTYSYIHEFSNLQLYQVSETVSFTPPVTSDYFVVDVMGPQWDWYKVNYPNRGYPDWVAVFDNDCIGFEIQMATDSTFDFN